MAGRAARPAALRTSGRRAPPGGTSVVELEPATWERIMRRLRVLSGLLGAALLALGVRLIVFGPATVTAATTAIIAVLLVAALLLTRHGRRLEPPSIRDRKGSVR
jgi:hypothetical protein